MRDSYVNEVIRRGNELSVLEQAALSVPKRNASVRWIVAAACGTLVALFPSVCSAYAFFTII